MEAAGRVRGGGKEHYKRGNVMTKEDEVICLSK